MHKQRFVKSELFRRPAKKVFWNPLKEQKLEGGLAGDPGESDWYAVVDDIDERLAVLEVVRWPVLDRAGRLLFGDSFELALSVVEIQQSINEARALHRQPAPERNLRVGDAFLIRSSTKPDERILEPSENVTILDITRLAREQAKIAMYGAVARKLPVEEESRRLKFTPDGEHFLKWKEKDLKKPFSGKFESQAKPEV
ncbi:MAG: hypothetical protein KAR40_04940 [Candidatus Sabulitectum sp.]|nr:hypothetical protein [Candidatus Sabulitectum sp.]